MYMSEQEVTDDTKESTIVDRARTPLLLVLRPQIIMTIKYTTLVFSLFAKASYIVNEE